MQAYTFGGSRAKATEILSAPPRSGEFSVYAQKITALAFIWLCALIVWGNVANFAGAGGTCKPHCLVHIIFAVIAWVYTSFLIMLDLAAPRQGILSREGCFSYGLEVRWISLLIVPWIPLLVSVSRYDAVPAVSVWFAWLGFFGVFYATYKAYHIFKEHDLPTTLPDGYDEEEYVYG